MWATPWGLLTFAVVFYAAWRSRATLRRLWRPHYCFALAQLLLVPGIVAIGVFWPAEFARNSGGYETHPNRFGENLSEALLYFSLAPCPFWIWRMKGIRWLAAALMLVLEVPVLFAAILAGLLSSGDSF